MRRTGNNHKHTRRRNLHRRQTRHKRLWQHRQREQRRLILDPETDS